MTALVPQHALIIHYHQWWLALLGRYAMTAEHNVYVLGDHLSAATYLEELKHRDDRKRLGWHHFYCQYARQLVVFGYAKMPLEVTAKAFAAEHAAQYKDLWCTCRYCQRRRRAKAWTKSWWARVLARLGIRK